MDIKYLINNAAKEGKLKKVKQYLSNKTADTVRDIVSSKVEGSTPLIAAARNGHLDVVQYLIVKCKSDMELRGSVNFDGEVIEEAPPLWCAAAAGHLSVVKCMIHYKANPNSTTMTNSTPLRAACFDGHLGIVKYLLDHKADVEIANRHGHTCLMIACYKGHKDIVKVLLEHGANVNRKSAKGNTAMHDCAESGSVDIMQLLLKHGAKMQKDGYGMTPLMAAAITGHSRVVEYLITRPETSKLDQIQALELLGSTYIDKKQDRGEAYKLWLRAITLRNEKPCYPKPFREPVPAYLNVIEASSKDDLEEVFCDPHNMRMQALLIRERILGPKHPDTSYYIRYRGAVFADAGDFMRCISLWMYALEMQQNNLEPLSPMTLSSLLSFAELFSFMQQEHPQIRIPVPKATHEQILCVLQKAAVEVELGSTYNFKATDKPTAPERHITTNPTLNGTSTSALVDTAGSSQSPQPLTQHQSQKHCCGTCEASTKRMYRAMGIVLHLIALSDLVDKDKDESKEQREEQFLKQKLIYNLRNIHDHRERTLLHLAVGADACPLGRYPVTTFPSPAVVDILIECGYNINAFDMDGNTPLHIAALASTNTESNGDPGRFKSPLIKYKTINNSLDTIQHLLKAGAHPDYINNKKKLFVEIILPMHRNRINLVPYQTLQCLAARCLSKNNCETKLPNNLLKCKSLH